ncbi:MAG: hypothetical protein QOK37_3898 [Thermoanaerobaculia bacterium]|jgi:hypothetical protein|nr:hypothetical protein [Thermoanaerobaculia bacterium]
MALGDTCCDYGVRHEDRSVWVKNVGFQIAERRHKGSYMRKLSLCSVATISFVLIAATSTAQWLPQPPIGSGPIYYNGGNVGVGTGANPVALLEIRKLATPDLFRVGDGTNYMNWYGAGSNDINAYGSAFRLYSNSSGFQFRTGAADPAVTILNNGNVGIGTPTPNFRLQVTADGNGLWPGDNGGGQLALTGASDTTKRLGLMIDTTNNVGVIAAEHYQISPYNLALQPGGGNVGIGTVSPNFRLQVTADGTGIWPADNGSGQFVLAGATDGTKRLGFMIDTTNNVGVIAAEQYQVSPYNLALQPGGGNVGIGTTVPVRPLSFSNVTGEKISLYSNSSATQDYYGFGIAPSELQYQAPATAHHSFYIGASERVRIDGAGNVGIATVPNSNYKLDVNGIAHVSSDLIVGGNLAAKYQDVAEWVPVAEEMSPGTVVVVSGTTKNTVGPSQHAYDTRVAGVVSAQPGLLLGVESSSKAKIATTGRVKVRVDATKRAIAMGDLLVTSDKPGLAMLSQPLDLGGIKIHRPGTLIGKALEPLAGGEGEILVLLSLQ